MRKYLKPIFAIVFSAGIIASVWALYTMTSFFQFYSQKRLVDVRENIIYREGSVDPKQRLDLYLPKDVKNFPVVHFIHGGYWYSGYKQYYQGVTGLYGNIGVALAERGIGVVIQSYRLAPDVPFSDQIDDVATAVAWTVNNIEQYGGDSTEVYVMGHSAGGQMTALLATDRRYLQEKNINLAIKGFIPISAIFDLPNMVATNDEAFNEQISYKVFGRDPKALIKYSPTTYFKSGLSPMLILNGQDDFPYIAAQDKAATDALLKLRNRVAYAIIRGYSHMDMVVRFGRDDDPVIQQVLNFIGKK